MYIPTLPIRDTAPEVTPVYTSITPLTASAIAAGIAADLFLTAFVIWLCIRHRRRQKAISRQRERMAENVATRRRASRWLSGVLLLGRSPSTIRKEREAAGVDEKDGQGGRGLQGIKEEDAEFEEVDLKYEKSVIVDQIITPNVERPSRTWSPHPQPPPIRSRDSADADVKSIKSFKSSTKSLRDLKYEAKEAKINRPLHEIGAGRDPSRPRSRSRSRSTKATAVQIVKAKDRDLDWGAMLGAPLTPRTPRQMVRAWEEYGGEDEKASESRLHR